MTKLTPAEDAAMFTKTAEWIASLDESDKIDLMMEVALYNMEHVIEMKLACDVVMFSMKKTDEVA